MQTKVFLSLVAILATCSVALSKDVQSSGKTSQLVQYGAENYDKMTKDGQLEYLNEMVDALMEELRELMGNLGLDPLPLPDVERRISFKPIIITYYGEFNLTEGWAQDVSEIYRDGNVVVDYTNRVLTFNVPISFKRLLFDYRYNVKIMGLGPTGGVDGRTENVRVFFSLSVDFKTMKLKLEDLNIVKIGKINVKFNGNVLFDWLVNLMTGVTVTVFKGLITLIVEIIVKNNLDAVIELVNGILANGTNTMSSTPLMDQVYKFQHTPLNF